MIEFVTAYMAPIMFVGLIVFLMIGFSVAFSLAASATPASYAARQATASRQRAACVAAKSSGRMGERSYDMMRFQSAGGGTGSPAVASPSSVRFSHRP